MIRTMVRATTDPVVPTPRRRFNLLLGDTEWLVLTIHARRWSRDVVALEQIFMVGDDAFIIGSEIGRTGRSYKATATRMKRAWSANRTRLPRTAAVAAIETDTVGDLWFSDRLDLALGFVALLLNPRWRDALASRCGGDPDIAIVFQDEPREPANRRAGQRCDYPSVMAVGRTPKKFDLFIGHPDDDPLPAEGIKDVTP